MDVTASHQNDIKKQSYADSLQLLTGEHLRQSPDSCIYFGKKTLEAALAMNDKDNAALAGKRIGYAYYQKGEFDSSLIYYPKAYDLYLAVGDYLGAAIIDNFFGDTHNRLGNYQTALNYFIKAEKSCDSLIKTDSIKLSVKRLYAIIYTNMGLLYFNLDSLNKPLVYFEKALKNAREINDSIRMAASYSNIGMVFRRQAKPDAAYSNYLQALAIAEKINHRIFQSAALNNIANIFRERGKYDSAMVYFGQAKRILEETGNKYGLSLVSRNIATVSLQLGLEPEALTSILEAVEISKEIDSRSEMYENYFVLSQVYEKTGDLRNAIHYYKMYSNLKDSVTGMQTREKIAEIQTKFETAKKEKENLLLRKDNQIKAIAIDQKNNALVFMGIGLVVIFTLLTIIFFLYKSKSRAFQKLVNQNLKSLKIEKKLEKSVVNIPDDGALRSNASDKYDDLSIRLEKFLIEEKPFLWSDVNMEEFCKKLKTNRTYLSKVINELYDNGFNDMICEHRIRVARKLLTEAENSHISVEGVGQMAGYKSNSTFHKKFKAMVGLTPDQFRKKAEHAAKNQSVPINI